MRLYSAGKIVGLLEELYWKSSSPRPNQSEPLVEITEWKRILVDLFFTVDVSRTRCSAGCHSAKIR
jgi:hypothetical protein